MPNDAQPSRRRATTPSQDPGFAALKSAIIARTGHHYYADKDDLLFDRLRKRFKARALKDASAYMAFLAGPEGNEEWSALEAEITIGETFFFRYAEQFAALRGTILPALIAARASERRLRIWSAGCASGAEPYSVAILLHDLLGTALPEWDLSIIGTDISAAALDSARVGEYGRWALRTLPPEERLRWFRPLSAGSDEARQQRFALRPEFRKMVRFERHNLLDLIDTRAPPIEAFDLVLCRNVLIYFSARHVNAIVRAFAARLGPDGWLLIGHAEPNPEFETWLSPVSLPGTVAYRPRGLVPASLLPARPAPETAWSILDDAPFEPKPLDLPRAPSKPIAPSTPTAIPESMPPEPRGDADEETLDRIRSLADAGESAEAWRRLRDSLATNPADPRLLHYQGLLARSLGREAEAERAFRGALFVDKDFVMAHVQLGLLLASCDRPVPARRALDNAMRLARAMPSATLLPEGDGASAGTMVATLTHALNSLPENGGAHG